MSLNNVVSVEKITFKYAFLLRYLQVMLVVKVCL